MRRLTRVLATIAVLGLGSGCASGGGDDVVTVTSKVVAPPNDAPSASPVPESPPSGSEPGSVSESAPASSPSSVRSATEQPSEPSTPTDSGTENGGVTTGSDDSSATGSSTGDPTGGSSDNGETSGDGFPIQTPTENLPNVSRDVAGPDKGRQCAADAKYWDEDPTGMRDDVIVAWRNVEKFANADGVIVCLNDGKRSTAQQQAQYDEYVAEYGKEVADQLVLAPENSAHVTGNAMDVQPAAAYQWLQRTEGALGLCRIYDNEPWHFEYDVAYFSEGCPSRLPKPQN